MPRSKQLNQHMRDKRRDSIIRKSLRLFAFNGYDALTVDGIADACRCSHGLFYHYFQSKELLFNAVVATYRRKLPFIGEAIAKAQAAKGSEGLRIAAGGIHDVIKNGGDALLAARLLEVKRSAVSIDEKTKASLDIFDSVPLLTRLVKENQEETGVKKNDPKSVVSAFLDWFHGISARRMRYKGEDFATPSVDDIYALLAR